jgi:hypothetical protein
MSNNFVPLGQVIGPDAGGSRGSLIEAMRDKQTTLGAGQSQPLGHSLLTGWMGM